MLETRVNKLLSLMKDHQLEAVIFVPSENMYYFTGIPLHASERLTLALVTSAGDMHFLVPAVELNKVEGETDGSIFYYSDEEGPNMALQQLKNKMGHLQKVGYVYGETRVREERFLQKLDFEESVDLGMLIPAIRMYKEEEEMKHMQKAVQIVEESLTATLPYIQSGVSELAVAARLEFEMRTRGSEGTPFKTIVASGYRGALPHGRASNKVIEKGDLVVLDYGSIYNGYVADITRTVGVGSVTGEMKNVYEIVKKANESAINKIKPGVKIHDIDEEARGIIREAGYGEYFTHRLGHGVGLNGHEEPFIMQKNEMVLRPGMAFTIEPGIYLKDKFGVRIEDNLIVTENGSLNLMTFTKELIVL